MKADTVGSPRLLSAYCTERTGVTQANVESAEPLPAVLLQFHRWLESNSYLYKRLCFVTLGDWALGKMLPSECARKHIPISSYFGSHIDLEKMSEARTGGSVASLLEKATFPPLPAHGVERCKSIGAVFLLLCKQQEQQQQSAASSSVVVAAATAATPIASSSSSSLLSSSSIVVAPAPAVQQYLQQQQLYQPPPAVPMVYANGDWNCPQCGAMSFASRVACFRCGAAKPEESGKRKLDLVDSSASSLKMSKTTDGNWDCKGCGASVFASKSTCYRCGKNRMGLPSGNWDCGVCGASVFPDKVACYRCGASRGAVPGGGAVGGGAPQQNWTCTACGASVFPSKHACYRCNLPRAGGGGGGGGYHHHQQQPIMNGDWTCQGCGANVFASKTACYRCQRPRATEMPYAAPPYNNPYYSGGGGGGYMPYSAPPPPVSSYSSSTNRRPGDWDCRCGALNYASRSACFKCGAPK